MRLNISGRSSRWISSFGNEIFRSALWQQDYLFFSFLADTEYLEIMVLTRLKRDFPLCKKRAQLHFLNMPQKVQSNFRLPNFKDHRLDFDGFKVGYLADIVDLLIMILHSSSSGGCRGWKWGFQQRGSRCSRESQRWATQCWSPLAWQSATVCEVRIEPPEREPDVAVAKHLLLEDAEGVRERLVRWVVQEE